MDAFSQPPRRFYGGLVYLLYPYRTDPRHEAMLGPGRSANAFVRREVESALVRRVGRAIATGVPVAFATTGVGGIREEYYGAVDGIDYDGHRWYFTATGYSWKESFLLEEVLFSWEDGYAPEAAIASPSFGEANWTSPPS